MKIKKKVEIKRPIVFVPMCLDYFHHGHANIINRAKRYGILFLGLYLIKAFHLTKKNRTTTSSREKNSINA